MGLERVTRESLILDEEGIAGGGSGSIHVVTWRSRRLLFKEYDEPAEMPVSQLERVADFASRSRVGRRMAAPLAVVVDNNEVSGFLMHRATDRFWSPVGNSPRKLSYLIDGSYREGQQLAVLGYLLELMLEVHEAGAIIGDLKPDNILISKSEIARDPVFLVDCDSWSFLDAPLPMQHKTDHMLPPELLDPSAPLSVSTDLYQFAFLVEKTLMAQFALLPDRSPLDLGLRPSDEDRVQMFDWHWRTLSRWKSLAEAATDQTGPAMDMAKMWRMLWTEQSMARMRNNSLVYDVRPPLTIPISRPASAPSPTVADPQPSASPPRPRATQILAALGGWENVTDIRACVTRLLVQVRDPGKVDRAKLQELGAGPVTISGEQIAGGFGTLSEILKDEMLNLRARAKATAPAANPASTQAKTGSSGPASAPTCPAQKVTPPCSATSTGAQSTSTSAPSSPRPKPAAASSGVGNSRLGAPGAARRSATAQPTSAINEQSRSPRLAWPQLILIALGGMLMAIALRPTRDLFLGRGMSIFSMLVLCGAGLVCAFRGWARWSSSWTQGPRSPGGPRIQVCAPAKTRTGAAPSSRLWTLPWALRYVLPVGVLFSGAAIGVATCAKVDLAVSGGVRADARSTVACDEIRRGTGDRAVLAVKLARKCATAVAMGLEANPTGVGFYENRGKATAAATIEISFSQARPTLSVVGDSAKAVVRQLGVSPREFAVKMSKSGSSQTWSGNLGKVPSGADVEVTFPIRPKGKCSHKSSTVGRTGIMRIRAGSSLVKSAPLRVTLDLSCPK